MKSTAVGADTVRAATVRAAWAVTARASIHSQEHRSTATARAPVHSHNQSIHSIHSQSIHSHIDTDATPPSAWRSWRWDTSVTAPSPGVAERPAKPSRTRKEWSSMFSTVRLGWQGGSGCGSVGVCHRQWQWQWQCGGVSSAVAVAVVGRVAVAVVDRVPVAVSRVFLCVSVSRVCLQQVTAGPPRHIDRKCGHINSTDQQLHTATQPDQQPHPLPPSHLSSHLSSHTLPPSHSHCHTHCHTATATATHAKLSSSTSGQYCTLPPSRTTARASSTCRCRRRCSSLVLWSRPSSGRAGLWRAEF
jgi:hypothetical protein